MENELRRLLEEQGYCLPVEEASLRDSLLVSGIVVGIGIVGLVLVGLFT